MAYISTHPLFRSLDDTEEEEFKQYARDNDPDDGLFYNSQIHHPVVCEVWKTRGFKDIHDKTTN